MGATMSLADFFKYCRDNRKRIDDIYREIEEIQAQFNGLYAHQLEERNGSSTRVQVRPPRKSSLELATLERKKGERQFYNENPTFRSGRTRRNKPTVLAEARRDSSPARVKPDSHQQKKNSGPPTRMQQDADCTPNSPSTHIPLDGDQRGQRKATGTALRLVDNLQSMTLAFERRANGKMEKTQESSLICRACGSCQRRTSQNRLAGLSLLNLKC